MPEVISAECHRQEAAVEGLTCRVETSFESLEALKEQWDGFVLKADGDIYLTFDWCATWWKYYGEGRSLKIFLFENQRGFAAVLPFFTETIRLGPVPVRLAKVVGSDYGLSLCHLPVSEDYAKVVFDRVFRDLIQGEGCDAVHLGPLSETYRLLPELESVCDKRAEDYSLAFRRKVSTHTLFHLPETFEEYLGSLDKKQRGNYRRDERLFGKHFMPGCDVVCSEDEVEPVFESFIQMHQTQWKAAGQQGHFKDWPKAKDFHRELVTTQVQAGRVAIFRLKGNDSVLAQQYCFQFGRNVYWRLPARVVGEQWDRFGLGRLGLVELIRDSIQRGMKNIEAGPSHYYYKLQMGGQEYSLLSLLIVSGQKASHRRVRWLVRWADWLHLFYYRILFCRVAPRVDFLQGPLWSGWLRTRI